MKKLFFSLGLLFQMSAFASEIELFSIENGSLFSKTQISEEYDKSEWLGMYCENQECLLKKTKMSVENKKDAITDKNAEDPDGKVVEFDISSPLFAVRGDKKIIAGKIRSIIFQPESLVAKSIRSIGSDCFLKNKLLSSPKRLLVTYTCGAVSQELGKYEGNDEVAGDVKNIALVWAGDLDGDGKIDLLLDTSPRRGEGSNLELKLSSRAAKGKLLDTSVSFQYWDPNNPGC